MTDKYRVHEIVKFNYSDIGEYIDENHTDRPLRNDILVKILNDLVEENEYLKQAYTQLKHRHSSLYDVCIDAECDRDGYLKDIASLEKENEQLKQFKEDVFNRIDMHLRMLPTARDNEFNEDDGDPSLYVGAIYMLETLKKELKE